MLCKYTPYSLIYIYFFAIPLTWSQDEFSSWSHVIPFFYSTNSIVTADLNGDYTDDLLIFNKGKFTEVLLNNYKGKSWKHIQGPEFNSEVLSSLVVDFDNDGNKEIVVGTSFDKIRIYSFDSKNESFSLYWTANELFYLQNMNAIDINNDGYLDLFVCNDNGENLIYVNNQTGGFTSEKIIDFTTTPSSDKSGNYGSVWSDVNGDGHIDLYIAKCRAGVFDEKDPRRINQLYINQGNGTFVEQAKLYGLDYGDQSWTADFEDLDGDGDMDVLVTNHGSPLIVAENINNTHFKKRLNTGLKELDNFWQAASTDINNDGRNDLIMVGSSMYAYINNGNFIFEPYYFDPVDAYDAFSFSFGDYDQNGSIDLITSHASGPSSFGQRADSVWLNQSNSNNWIQVALEGTISNRDGVGARVEVYSNLGMQTKIVKAGISYGTMNSLKLQFGLSTNSKVDSIMVFWPSGTKTKIQNPSINKVLYIKENTCAQSQSQLIFDQEDICLGEEKLYTIDTPNSVHWSISQSNENSIMYSGSEAIFAAVQDSSCLVPCPIVFPNYQDTVTIYTHEKVLDAIFPICQNSVFPLIPPNANSYYWQDGNTDSIFYSKEMGIYQVMLQYDCHQVIIEYDREDQLISVLWPIDPFETNASGDVDILIGADSIEWFLTKDNETTFHAGNELTLENLTTDTSFFAEAIHLNRYQTNIGLEMPGVNSGTPFSNLNPAMHFEVHQALQIYSVDCYTDVSANRKIQIFQDTNLVYEEVHFISAPFTQLNLNVNLTVGEYSIQTDSDYNIEGFNAKSPYLKRDLFAESNYPYVDSKGLIHITGNSINSSSYFFFYNWQVGLEDRVCRSDRQEIFVKCITNTLQENEKRQLECFQNPVQHELVLLSSNQSNIQIVNAIGQVVLQTIIMAGYNRIDVWALPAGIYFVRDQTGITLSFSKM